MIHPSAVIHPQAKLGPGVRVGPCAVIDADVELGADCDVGPQVYITGVTKIGSGNRFHAGAVIGDAPQDLKYNNAPTRVFIGDHNIFRENVTVHRATTVEGETRVGSNCLFMAGSHIGHNSQVGNHVIMANGSLLGGHAIVYDKVFISGNCAVHQFSRVGTLAMMQGGGFAGQDVPPYTVLLNGKNTICGLNSIGLRRAGIAAPQRLELKRLYHFLFRSGKNLREAAAEARGQFTSVESLTMLDFIATSKRGMSADIKTHHQDADEE